MFGTWGSTFTAPSSGICVLRAEVVFPSPSIADWCLENEWPPRFSVGGDDPGTFWDPPRVRSPPERQEKVEPAPVSKLVSPLATSY